MTIGQDHKALREANKEAADASLVLGKFPGCNLGITKIIISTMYLSLRFFDGVS